MTSEKNCLSKYKKNEDMWIDWLNSKGLELFQLPLPPSALKDSHYFCDFVYDYADRFPIEPFSIDTLTDKQAFHLLCILDSYFFDYCYNTEGWYEDDRACSHLYVDIRKRFNILGEDFAEFPPIPKELFIQYEMSLSWFNRFDSYWEDKLQRESENKKLTEANGELQY